MDPNEDSMKKEPSVSEEDRTILEETFGDSEVAEVTETNTQELYEKETALETESEPAVASAEETNESREFLRSIGIEGEIISTPSHSEDSISVILDCGDCFVGDLEPYEYLDGYEDNPQLQKD